MLTARRFLIFQVIVWLPYGIACLLKPVLLEDFAGLAAMSSTARTEVRAMYGGLQAAIGLLALVAIFRDQYVAPALTTLAFLGLGLGSARALGLLLDGGVSGYTVGALSFETLNTGAAIFLLTRGQAELARPDR